MNNITKQISISLAAVLLMFPQIIETMYSPALPSVKNHFGVTSSEAGQALSVFFFAFAIGVVFWGRMCDTIGRRYSTITGLIVFVLSAISTIFAPDFNLLLVGFGFGFCAFAAAVGSVCTQTIIRDGYQGQELGRVFSIVGSTIGVSPIVGMLVGSWLMYVGDYTYVFVAMAVFVILLLIWCLMHLPETKPVTVKRDSFLSIALMMLKDPHIWFVAIMVCLFNIGLFSYYSIAPFMFEKLGASVQFFGNTGFVLALGSFAGALLNVQLIRRNFHHDRIVFFGAILLLVGGLGVLVMQHSVWFFIPVIMVPLAFGLAIPNLMSTALKEYQDHLGSAGAILGLLYYLMIGFGLHKATEFGNLPFILLSCAVASLVFVSFYTLYKAMVSIDLWPR